jgi:hypothetical protein
MLNRPIVRNLSPYSLGPDTRTGGTHITTDPVLSLTTAR